MQRGPLPMIDCQRVRRRLEKLSEIGRDPEGGISRFSYTEEYRAALELFAGWCREAGLNPRIDAAGNLVARYEGTDSGAPVIALGSHLDTVPNGGPLDGALGCVAGLECLQSLVEEGRRPAHPLETLVFVEEEGTRFGSGLLGSRAVAGKLTPAALAEMRDRDGTSAAQAMENYGLRPLAVGEASRRSSEFEAYLELHIEQGPTLDSESVPIGIVSSIAGIWRYTFRFVGEAAHAGTTPLPVRRDALMAAARWIPAVRDAALQLEGPGNVATVGHVDVKPGAINVVPAEAAASLELRAPRESALHRLAETVLEEARRIAAAENIGLEVESGARIAPVAMDERVILAVENACRRLGIAFRHLPSGAGHDAQAMAALCPAGMIFVPSAGGISHAPEEFTPWDQIEAGLRVMAETIQRLDQGDNSEG